MARKQTLTEAFRRFGAGLANPQWSVSTISSRDELVVSCWNLPEYLYREGDALLYKDRLSRWPGSLGNRKLAEHLDTAWRRKLTVRLVQATPDDPEDARRIVASGMDASEFRKHFHARDDLVGRFVSYDGDLFVFEFRKMKRGA